MAAEGDRAHHAIVCGGGPAGLSAAMWLGRYRRKTLLVDSGEQRNLPAQRSHGYLTRDGSSPRELIDAARSDVARYPTVGTLAGSVTELREESGSSFGERGLRRARPSPARTPTPSSPPSRDKPL